MLAEPVGEFETFSHAFFLTIDQMNAVITAGIVALFYVLCNVFQKEIVNFLSKPGSVPARLGSQGAVKRIDPFGNFPILPFTLPMPSAPASITIVSSSLPTTPSQSTTSLTSSQPPPQPTAQPILPPLPAQDPTESIPHSPGVNEYHFHAGDGSTLAGWPHKEVWMSYGNMYFLPILPFFSPSTNPPDRFSHNIPLISRSCTFFHVPLNTPPETEAIHNATLLIALETNTDPRFILAIILQESNGCVRVPTTYYSTRNPGLMQSHNGPATCNEGPAGPVYPCPYVTIEEMIREGTAGTSYDTGMGLVEALRAADRMAASEGQPVGEAGSVQRYYRAARIYNSGSVDPSGDLGKGVATHCYASDVANRLTGWSEAEKGCGEGSGGMVLFAGEAVDVDGDDGGGGGGDDGEG
ncbi:MAG: hypothetical protein Q9220_002678 [cf. Caloplaca sp. 1 TL-2023]